MLRVIRSPARQHNVVHSLRLGPPCRWFSGSSCGAEATQQMPAASDLGLDKTAIRKQLKQTLRQTPVQELEEESRPEYCRLLPLAKSGD